MGSIVARSTDMTDTTDFSTGNPIEVTKPITKETSKPGYALLLAVAYP